MESLPPTVRAIAFSSRGLKGSAPYTADEVALKATPTAIAKQHVKEMIKVLFTVVEQGKIPNKHEGGGISLVCWSQGSLMITGLFAWMDEIPHALAMVQDHVDQIVFYEPPMSAVYVYSLFEYVN
jgi:hypothetical protein